MRWTAALCALAALTLIGTWLDWWSVLVGHRVAAWNWIERVSWFVAIGSGVAAAVASISARRRDHGPPGASNAPMIADTVFITAGEAYAMPRIVGGVAASIPGRRASSGDGADPINQVNERDRLVAALKTDRSSVILVHGRAGGGKTTLVRWVLRETGLARELREHDLSAGPPLDVRALLDDIALGTAVGQRRRPGEDLLSRLEAAMQASDHDPVTILVQNAQRLVDPDQYSVTSLELNEAFEILSGGLRRVKVILELRDVPVASTAAGWFKDAPRIGIDGLPPQEFGTYVEQLDAADRLGLSSLARTEPDLLYHVLQGVPRLAQLFRTVLTLAGRRLEARELAELLAREAPSARAGRLSQVLVEWLSDEQRLVVIALAAYRVPVAAEQVSGLLADETAAGRVAVVLPELVDSTVITAVGHRYHLLSPEVYDELARRPDGPARLLPAAADLLSRRRRPIKSVKRIEDLDLHFAELDIRIRAELWLSAYSLINEMERALSRWQAGHLVLPAREALADNLGKPFREMQNDNALGCIYLSRGRIDDARTAFESAVQHASRATWRHGRRKLFINLAAAHWEAGDAARAGEYYLSALGMAEEEYDALDQAAALSGLAKCLRRRGAYPEAIRRGRAALSLARNGGHSSAVDIAISLARWHSELREVNEADRLMGIADEAAREHPEDPSLRVRCLDARADLLLETGYLGEAARIAHEAVTWARELQDPVTVLQARTTLTMVFLRNGHPEQARREIQGANRYRLANRSLVVLALQALTAFVTDSETEARSLFRDLQREAVKRHTRDGRDFAAWDFEGLAIVGQRVGSGKSLDPAVEAFRRARDVTPVPPPVLRDRLKFMLELLRVNAAPGEFDAVLATASGTEPRFEPS